MSTEKEEVQTAAAQSVPPRHHDHSAKILQILVMRVPLSLLRVQQRRQRGCWSGREMLPGVLIEVVMEKVTHVLLRCGNQSPQPRLEYAPHLQHHHPSFLSDPNLNNSNNHPWHKA